MICSQCKRKVERDSRFCSYCGNELPVPPSSTSRTGTGTQMKSSGVVPKINNEKLIHVEGDVGMVKASIDASQNTHIENPIYIEGKDHKIYFSSGNQGEDYETSIQQGVRLTRQHAYSAAVKCFQQALASNPLPHESDFYYYFCLALLEGGRPSRFDYNTIEVLERYLEMACSHPRVESHHYYLWAWVKFDYYSSSGRLELSPGYRELLSKANSLPISHEKILELIEIASISSGGPVIQAILQRKRF